MPIKRWILSSAQNNTRLHGPVWDNVVALRKRYGATLLVSRYLYETRFHKNSSKPGTGADREPLWYDPRIAPYLCDQSTTLAPGLVFCGEVQILPTAKRPITGFESYTGRASCILPHAKFAMQSIASGKNEATKLIYTTGTVTKRNYLQKKAGQLAQFHHGYGAVLVEVDDKGGWWVRQLNADNSGRIYDLDLCVHKGKITKGHRVEAINWGDIHARRQSQEVLALSRQMIAALKPKHQFFHDVLDFRSRNHHEIKDAHKMFERYASGQPAEDIVGAEVQEAAKRLGAYEGGKLVVVSSNHDDALKRWLNTADYRLDPANAMYFLTLQKDVYAAILRGDKSFSIFERAMRNAGVPKGVTFLKEDQSYVICKDANGGIECGMHGHLGPNGARGSPVSFARMGRKANLGHSHSSGIWDGVYVAGTSSELDLGYNRGPGSWTWSHIVTQPNGKRQIITMWKGKYRA